MQLRVFVLCLFGLLLLTYSNTYAFNSVTHENITRSALIYLRSHTHASPYTSYWLTGLGRYETLMEELLVRANIDADYHADLWIDGMFVSPVAGGKRGKQVNFFTTMYHFLNVTVPGTFFENEGYAYRYSSKEENDALLDTFSATIKASLSSPLGNKQHPEHELHGIFLGRYRYGFKGDFEKWKSLFYDSDASKAVFPPANVPAQLAFNKMLASERAPASLSDSWKDSIPLVSTFISTTSLNRQYWRAEVEGLPKGFDLLGMTVHLAQDMCMPHHTFGTASYCHAELETFIDRYICESEQNISITPYDIGDFGGSQHICQSQYDPQLVESLLKELRFLALDSKVPVHEIIKQLALITSQWRWGRSEKPLDYLLYTKLPNGDKYQARTCDVLMKHRSAFNQIHYQYNLAVAATIALFELAADQYEKRHPRAELESPSLLDQLKNLF